MQRRIHQLDSLTIDKVAAGEVIDVPASCIKELVENAIDAGADDILIETQLGGRELIRVTDNGCGMCRDDVISSIERHTTSKLSSIDDLETLSSMGFRGEALASIVAISRVRITSGERQQEKNIVPATLLCAEGGKLLSVNDTKSYFGTTVEVSDLFYNVPARRKFLKSPSKDTQEALKMVMTLALASPHVSFRLIADGKCSLTAPKESSFIARSKALLGDPFSRSTFEIQYSTEGLTLTGVIAEPQYAKTTRAGSQYLFVNGRPVISLPLSYTVKNAFGSSCEQNKHPLFSLSLFLDPSTIDVNIHPQKKEVRFSDEEWVKTHVYESVAQALFGGNFFSAPIAHGFSPSMPSLEEKKYFQDFVYSPPKESFYKEELFSLPEKQVVKNEEKPLVVLGDLLLLKKEESVLVLDLKSAMKAVVYKDLCSSKKGTGSSEGLLVPIRLQCSEQESSLLVLNNDMFASWGFVIRPFGPHSFLVEGLPPSMKGVDVEKFLKEAIHEPDLVQKRAVCSLCRIAALSVASMNMLKSPISLEVAHAIFLRWCERDRPAVAPDGTMCAFILDEAALRGLL